MKKRFFIETFGCQMNVYDSELVTGLLIRNGFEVADSLENADILLVNTCAIREKAVERVINKMNQYAHYKKKGGLKIAGILGCIPQYSSDRLKKELPFLDILSGPDSYEKLPGKIKQCLKDRKLKEDTVLSGSNYDNVMPYRENAFSSFVTIMRGCDNFCSYCVVPYVRGRERSRDPEQIIREVRISAEKGISEITLLGQNVNSYISGEINFPKLLRMVSKVEGVKRLRFATSHPKDISDELIREMADNPKVCRHLHLPFQAGSDEILKKMNRGYTREEYLEKVDRIRAAMPDIALTTDIIVGFPGETEDDFNKTLDVIRKARFDNSFMFIYSERDLTFAKKHYKDDVSRKVKTERLKILAGLQKETGLEQMRGDAGKIKEVLIESLSRKKNGEMMGRTDQNRTVVFPKKEGLVPGVYAHVKIVRAEGVTMFGEVVNKGEGGI